MEKVAIIELNENALKLSIYKVNNAKYVQALAEEQPLNLGVEINRDELLSPQTKNKILEILKVYRKMIENFNVSQIFAVCTSIMIKARN